MSEIKKNNVPEEIKDDELDLVAGGAYTAAEWLAMTVEERRAAQNRSNLYRNNPSLGKCELD